MRVEIIPCLNDNYSYLVVCEKTNDAAIVDASEKAPVLEAASKLAKPPIAIWSTHHHFDHTGGNEEVKAALKIGEIVGHESDKGRIPLQTRFVRDGESFALGSLRVDVLHIPGHTTGAIAYVVTDGSDSAVFTGDTLFVAGCGRLFEGTPEMMFSSLRKLARLAPDTAVYCGHEYTEANLRFAKHVEPNNVAIDVTLARVKNVRAKNQPSVPSTIGDELAINPFMRAKDATELGARRTMKDSFK